MKSRIYFYITAFAIVTASMFHNSLQAQDAEYQLILRQYTVNSDNSVDIRYRKEIKLLRNRAITAYADKGETFILYNPGTERLTINDSYTVRKDGSRVQTPENGFIDQLPSQCENCGRYNGLRERVVVHTALEYDCLVVLDYTIHRSQALVDEKIQLNQDCPVKKYEIIVDAGQNKTPLKLSWLNDNLKAKSVNDGHSYHFEAKNLEQTYNERYMPPSETLYPTLHIAIGDTTLTFNQNEKLAEAADLLTELKDDNPLKYATNIRDYVVDYVIHNNIPLPTLMNVVSPAEKTFSSNCGTTADKSALLAAMLRQAGYDAKAQKDMVYVEIADSGVTMTYAMSPISKNRILPYGLAIDEQRTIEANESMPWNGHHIGDWYCQMTLPKHRGTINIDPAQLAPSRTAPLKVRNCSEKYHYSIILPRTPKYHLATNDVKIKYTKKGVGYINIEIKESTNNTIEVTRELNIDVADEIVSTKQYKAFRQMISDWNEYQTITVIAKPSSDKE